MLPYHTTGNPQRIQPRGTVDLTGRRGSERAPFNRFGFTCGDDGAHLNLHQQEHRVVQLRDQRFAMMPPALHNGEGVEKNQAVILTVENHRRTICRGA